MPKIQKWKIFREIQNFQKFVKSIRRSNQGRGIEELYTVVVRMWSGVAFDLYGSGALRSKSIGVESWS